MIALSAALGGTRPAAAQTPTPTAAAVRGPTLPTSTSSVSRVASLRFDTRTQRWERADASRGGVESLLHPNGRQSVGLMIGGVAAVVAGAAVKGTAGGILAFGGAVAVFHGLYHYLMRDDGTAAAPNR